jgi:hypothetical protein
VSSLTSAVIKYLITAVSAIVIMVVVLTAAVVYGVYRSNRDWDPSWNDAGWDRFEGVYDDEED